MLREKGYYVHNYEESFKKIVLESFKVTVGGLLSRGQYQTKYFAKIEAKTLKNKSLLIIQEKIPIYPHYQLVFVLKNPKNCFPSFKLKRNPADSVSVPKTIQQRDITKYYSLSTQQWDVVISKLQTYQLKRHYRKIANQIFELEYDRKFQTITVFTNRFKTALKQILEFILVLDETMEDYKELSAEESSIHKELAKESIKLLQNSITIYNAVSLVNTTTLKEKCVICWSKLDYSSETLLFECCSGYAHLAHGIDWLHEKEKCPKCGQSNPYTLQLPKITHG